jgi:hypothetical protein
VINLTRTESKFHWSVGPCHTCGSEKVEIIRLGKTIGDGLRHQRASPSTAIARK